MIRKTLPATQLATFCVELPNKAKQGMPSPIGSGFFVSPDGWFVTAAHVITENNEPDGTVRSDLDQTWLMKETRVSEGTLGAMCQAVSFERVLPELDVAVLKVNFSDNANKEWLKGRTDFPYLTVSSRELAEGEGVYSFGYPLSRASVKTVPGVVIGSTSLCPRVTSAIVSSTLEMTKMVMTGADQQVYVLDKALNYGNSGGPVVSAETGHVHALCSRFQPVDLPQPHLKNANGDPLVISVPSLYGVVSRLSNKRLLALFQDLQVPLTDE